MGKDDSWAKYEPEVSHYFQHEPGARTANLDPDSIGSGGGEPRPPQFPPGADYWTMMTVAERLVAADKIMPCIGVRYETLYEMHGDGVVRSRQEHKGDGRPSASMVLRAAYGTLSCKFDDSAPSGGKLLAEAKRAYMNAAVSVPVRKRTSATDRLERLWDRVFKP